MYFTTPNKSKSIQARRKEECLQEDVQRRGPQTSYCSEEREEKEKREEKKKSRGGKFIPSLALHHRRPACCFY